MSKLPRITISARNPHLLATDDGKPYLMVGDTAWEMLHRLDLEEIHEYFKIRASQSFNMIWANVLPEFDGLTTPNRYGDLPLIDGNPEKPNERYFEFVDKVLHIAESHGLYLGLLPAWGDKLTAPWGAGPRIFDTDNLSAAEGYAAYLGNRYSGQSNILWVLGGDRPAKIFGEPNQFPLRNAIDAGLPSNSDWTPIWRAMAQGLRKEGASHLITYHPQGGTMSTSAFLHGEEWLDLNALQSGHGGGHDVPVWESISRDYGLEPIKPTFDSEPNYEDHPVNPWPVWDPASGFYDSFDVRKQIYRSIFAGGCGVIYGHHCVWQFASARFEPVLDVLFDWKAALARPGAQSLTHLVGLLNSVDFLSLVPNQSRIVGTNGAGPSHARAIASDSVSLVYVPDGREIEVDLKWTNHANVIVEVFDPTNGIRQLLEETPTSQETLICPPIETEKDRVILVRKSVAM